MLRYALLKTDLDTATNLCKTSSGLLDSHLTDFSSRIQPQVMRSTAVIGLLASTLATATRAGEHDEFDATCAPQWDNPANGTRNFFAYDDDCHPLLMHAIVQSYQFVWNTVATLLSMQPAILRPQRRRATTS